MPKLTLLQQTSQPEQVDEDLADIARRVKAGAKNVVSKVQSKLSTKSGTGLDDSSFEKKPPEKKDPGADPNAKTTKSRVATFSEASIAKEFQSSVSTIVNKTNLAGRTVLANLQRQNIPQAEYPMRMAKLLRQAADQWVQTFWKGGALEIAPAGEGHENEISVIENQQLVRKHATPLVILRALAITHEMVAKGPYFEAEYGESFRPRVVNLRHLIDANVDRLEPASAAPVDDSTPATEPHPLGIAPGAGRSIDVPLETDADDSGEYPSGHPGGYAPTSSSYEPAPRGQQSHSGSLDRHPELHTAADFTTALGHFRNSWVMKGKPSSTAMTRMLHMMLSEMPDTPTA